MPLIYLFNLSYGKISNQYGETEAEQRVKSKG